MRRFAENDIISLIGEAPRYDLSESLGPPLHLAELLQQSGPSDFREIPLSYPTAEGDPRLRAAISGWHGVKPDDVVVTAGCMHALFLVAFILCDRDSEAVTSSPLFPLARNVLEAVGANLRVLPLSFDRAYQPDLAEFRAQLSERTRLVSLASPQNPSGVAIPPETLCEMLDLMEQVCPSAYLLLDETYRAAAFGDDPEAASAVVLSPRVISVASLSKCHGAPGLRVGWAMTRDPVLRKQLVLGKFNTTISCSALDEAMALKVFEQGDRIIGERRQRLADGLARTAEWAMQNGDLVDWVRPDAGALCCVRLKSSVFDDAAVSRFYPTLASMGIRVANGTWFGEEARVFRLGFGWLSPPDLQDALTHLAAALRQTLRVAA
jgi:aspartate/methionine/tyrosine aminotransferase